MSGKVVGWAFSVGAEHKLSPTEILVLVAIADNSDDDGEAYPGRKKLIVKTGLGRSTVYRTLDDLRDKGLLEYGFREEGMKCFRLAVKGPKSPGAGQPAGPGAGQKVPERDAEVPQRDSLSIEEPSSQPSTEPSPPAEPAADAPLCNLLSSLLEANGVPEAKRRVSKAWRDAERLMLERDGRDYQQAETLLRWATNHDFWRPNVLSMTGFRSKYDQIRLQAERDGGLAPPAAEGGDEFYDG